MASFIGTNKEFKRFIGPRARNRVNTITRKYIRSKDKCEHCGGTETRLEAAHITGRERTQLIDNIVEEFTNGELITIDLEVFESRFEADHHPINENILALCNKCHKAYDAQQPAQNIETEPAAHVDDVELQHTDTLPANREITDYIRTVAPGVLSDEEVENLTRPEYCKITFDINYAALKPIPTNASPEDIRKLARDDTGYARWSTQRPVEKNERHYLVTTQWYDRNRLPFVQWKARIEDR